MSAVVALPVEFPSIYSIALSEAGQALLELRVLCETFFFETNKF